MKKSPRAFTGIEVLAAVVIVGSVLFFGKSVYNHLPFLPHSHGPNPTQVALVATNEEEAKIGQQYASAAGQKLAQSTASDPAIVEAKQLSAKADTALALGLGSLNAEQAQWVQGLVSKHDAAFQTAIDSKDAQLVSLDQKAQALEKKLADSQGNESLLWYWIKFAGAAYVFFHFVLPWLGTKFPAIGVVSDGINAVLSPVIADLRAKESVALAEVKAKIGTAITSIRAKLPAASGAVVAEFNSVFDNTTHQPDIAAAAVNAAVATASNAAAAAAQQAITSTPVIPPAV